MLVMVPPKQTIGFRTGNSSAVRGTWPKSFLDALGAYPDKILRPKDDGFPARPVRPTMKNLL